MSDLPPEEEGQCPRCGSTEIAAWLDIATYNGQMFDQEMQLRLQAERERDEAIEFVLDSIGLLDEHMNKRAEAILRSAGRIK